MQEENNRNDQPKSAALLRYKQSYHQSNEEDIREGKPGIIKPTSTKNLDVMSQKYIPAKAGRRCEMTKTTTATNPKFRGVFISASNLLLMGFPYFQGTSENMTIKTCGFNPKHA